MAVSFVGVAVGGNTAYGVKVVVIDAGHGGVDAGAHYAGVTEKYLTLKVALKLGQMIEQGMPGVKVVYTRKTDKALGPTKFDDLQARASIANRAGGDLFISIHVNAARATSARGVETLIMGESPKEQRYNEEALFENNKDELIDMSDEKTAAIVRAYIQNLQFTYGEYSEAMARCIQKNYVAAGRHSRGVKRQLLRVLYATDMPGVLTEIGFLSNSAEAAYMKSDKGQTEIARSLYKSVRDYSDYVLGVRGHGSGSASSAAQPVETRPSTKNDTPSASSEQLGRHKSEQLKGGAAQPAAGGKVNYAVQVLAHVKPVSLRSSEFKKYRGKVRQYRSDGRFKYKYCLYETSSRAEAQSRLKEVRKVFPEAFVVKCSGGRIVK